MDTTDTIRRISRLIAGFTILCGIATAQPAWRKLGNDSVGLNLAGPAGGPIDAVWFAPSGDRLFVRTHSGRIFETTDYTTWTQSRPDVPIGHEIVVPDVKSPEAGAKIQYLQGTAARLYALGLNLQVSDDSGQTWTNLTAYNREPVIGPRQHSVAVAPLDSRQLVVANDYGVWRSADGGMSWAGLNEELPNLPIRRLLPSASPGTIRAEIAGAGIVELPPAAAAAHTNWVPSADSTDPTAGQRRAASQALQTEITALARTPVMWFAGSADGRIWTSVDSGKSWMMSQRVSGPVEAIRTAGENAGDPASSALLVASSLTGNGAQRLLRTTDGRYWEDLSLGLPEGELHGVAVDGAAGVAYVAGEHGVYMAHVDLNAPAPVGQWQRLRGLPDVPAMDVMLDSVRNLLYVAVDGYGLYSAPAPHRSAAVRVLTAADQPADAAAPGVLLHVQGSGLSRIRSESGDLPLVASSQSSAQVQVPFEASGSTLALLVDSSQGPSRFALPLKPVAPSILVDADGLPILVDAASGLTLDSRNMARPGARIQVFAAGLGKVDPEWRAGMPAPDDPPVVTARVEARLNGGGVEVTRATLAPGYVGLYLVEVQLPGLVNAGVADFSLVVNGEPSNHVKLLLTVD
jgi:uncharacterized protein (TIGR03437 family)